MPNFKDQVFMVTVIVGGGPSSKHQETLEDDRFSSRSDGPVPYVVYYMNDSIQLLEVNEESTAKRGTELPPNPTGDYVIKLDRASGDYFLSSESLNITMWAPCLQTPWDMNT